MKLPQFEWSGQRALAQAVLQMGAVELRPNQPFTLSSGWNSPIYCDYRTVLGYPRVWDLVLQGLVEALDTVARGTDVIAGTATAGIPHAAALARVVRLPMAYVRSSAKSHGKQKQVEGKFGPGLKTVVIEDALSTGKSAYDAVRALKDEGMNVLAVLAIYAYDFPVLSELANMAEVPFVRLLGYDTLIETALELGYVSERDMAALRSWRQHPERYGV